MDKKRRKIIQKCYDDLQLILSLLEEMQSIEESCLENIPESFIDTDRYSNLEECCEHLESAIRSVEESISELESIL